MGSLPSCWPHSAGYTFTFEVSIPAPPVICGFPAILGTTPAIASKDCALRIPSVVRCHSESHILDSESCCENTREVQGLPQRSTNSRDRQTRKPRDTTSLRHVMRAILLVGPNCSHTCLSLKDFPLEAVLILKHATRISTEQTAMTTKWFTHIAIKLFRNIS